MKLVAVLLCACVAGALGTFAPVIKTSGVVGKAGFGINKAGAEKLKAAAQVRGADKRADAAQQVESHDVKKSSIDQDWEKQASKDSHDATSQRQAHGQKASGWNKGGDAANKASSKAAASSADKAAKDKWASNSNFEKQQAWAGSDGFKKSNKKHEGISFSFDKKFRRNDNDNGGFRAGHSLADHALDDTGLSRSSYDRVGGDHAARTGHANRQSADRSSGFGDGAWRNAASADRHGRDRNQAASGHANDRDWAEKRDDALNADRYNRYETGRAADALNKRYALDRNANRDTLGFGATSKGLYGKGAGVVSPVGYGGYGLPGARKAVGNFGLKGLNKAKGVSDRSNLWDSADVYKNQNAAAVGQEDSNKRGNVANQHVEDVLKGFNKGQNGWHYDKGFAQDAAARDQGARAANQQWADADSARVAQQARHDNDEVVRTKDNNKWNRSDRDRKVNEWKKFYNNDTKGGQNWERLKFNKDQTEDAAAGDFAHKQDHGARWQDAHRFDERNQAAHSTDAARARDASDKHWNQDAGRDAAGAQRKAAAARDGRNSMVWAANNDRRKLGIDQARDQGSKNSNAWKDLSKQREGYDARSRRGSQDAFGRQSAYPGYGGYNNYNAYPSYGGYYGNQGYGNRGYGNNYNNYYGNNYGKGYGGFPNNYYYH